VAAFKPFQKFQFLLVRLKAMKLEKIEGYFDISIPFGAIKSAQTSTKKNMPCYFNSFWCD